MLVMFGRQRVGKTRLIIESMYKHFDIIEEVERIAPSDLI